MTEQRDSEQLPEGFETKPSLNEFQQEVNNAIELFWQAAQAKRGRVMGDREVRLVAAYISGLTEGVMQLENQVGFLSNMLAAYKEEYGSTLYDTLTEQSVVEAEVVEVDAAARPDEAQEYIDMENETINTVHDDGHGGPVKVIP